MVVTLLSLVVLAVIGMSVDLVMRYRVEMGVFEQAEQVAGQWSAAARNRAVPHPIPAFTRIDLIQLVDAHGRVLDASRAAAGLPALSRGRPPPEDRFNYLTECSPRSGCVMMMAIRVTPAPDSGVIYAGMTEPRVLARGTASSAPGTFRIAWYELLGTAGR
jgi:hypothetical protein